MSSSFEKDLREVRAERHAEHQKMIADNEAKKRKLSGPSADGGSGVEYVEPGAGGHKGSGSKPMSPDPGEDSDDDVQIVEPGAGGHGSSADKPMQEGSKQDYVCKTTLSLVDRRDVDIAGTECLEVVVYLYASQTCTIKVKTEIPREHLFISHTPQIEFGFCEEQPKDFTITAKPDAILQDGSQRVLFYHTETNEAIGIVSVNIRA